MDMAQKDEADSESRKLYLECLGQLVGITFKPGTDLKETVVSRQQCELASTETDTYVVGNISTEKSKCWKPGALSSCLRRLGFDPHGKRVHCADPLKPTAQEILPSLVFPQRKNVVKQNENVGIVSSLKRNAESLNETPNDNSATAVNKKRRQDICSEGWESTSSGLATNNPEHKTPNLFTAIHANSDLNQRSNHHQNNPNQHYSKKPTSYSAANEQSDDEMDELENENKMKIPSGFQTATTVLMIQDKERGIKRDWTSNKPNVRVPGSGLSKSDIIQARKKFVESVEKSENEKKKPDLEQKEVDKENNMKDMDPELAELLSHPQLKNFDAKLVEAILSEVMQPPQVTKWEDIAGLTGPKKIINEVIIWPMLRPEIFNGLRAPAKGILLFGPRTGKTMIGRVIASASKSTFFNISASSLTSKWIGEGEKLVRCLFQLARIKQPSVIFIDEIDSILTSRNDTEHESSRRMKTEFLVQFDGCGTTSEDRVLVIGVTNRPQELDDAARRRLVKRIYIPLPDIDGRIQIVKNLMAGQKATLTEADFKVIGKKSDGFSGADMKSLCQDASYGPIREIMDELETITPERVRDIKVEDFRQAFKQVKSSVADADLTIYEDWDSKFGSHARE